MTGLEWNLALQILNSQFSIKKMQSLFEKLRNEYPCFSYESFNYELTNGQLNIEFLFSIGEKIRFTPKLQIPQRDFYHYENLNSEELDLLVFHIGMIELISYWKSCCSPKIIIKPFQLKTPQIKFWKKLYYNGLGEFFHTNKITTHLDAFVEIVCESEKETQKLNFKLNNDLIIPIGGGKDSVVSLELLKQAGFNITPMIINPRGASLECVKTAGYQTLEMIEVHRNIDPTLLDLNAKGFLNGHTPFSAMLAFVSLLCSAISEKRHIVLSNESSANESTVKNTDVNHQYSKSFEFEIDFRNYVAEFISEDFNYFSFLRPINELQIAKLFSQQEAYFPVFKSCNAGSKTDIWCGNCPKCLFVYIILSPFIEPEKLQNIFQKDLFADENLRFYFRQLTGIEEEKPFECVGTIDEVNAALQATIKRYMEQGLKLPLLLQEYQSLSISAQPIEILLQSFEKDHYLTADFEKALKNQL